MAFRMCTALIVALFHGKRRRQAGLAARIGKDMTEDALDAASQWARLSSFPGEQF